MIRVIIISFIVLVVLMIIVAVVAIVNPQLIQRITGGKTAKIETNEAETPSQIADCKSFLPYDEILDYSLDMGVFNYRAVIEVSSINYGLLSATEQQMVDASYRNFLDSLDFPIELYIQTREFDTESVVKDLENRSSEAIKKFPQLRDYSRQYIEEMSMITERFGNSKVKKKFVIVPFNQTDLQDVSELSANDIKNFCIEELISRCNIVCSGLEAIGLETIILNKIGIAECLYSYYHRDSFHLAEDIIRGSFSSLVINAKEDYEPTERVVLDGILSRAQNEIKTKLVTASASNEEIKFYKYIYDELDKFKQDDKDMDMTHLFYSTLDAAEREGYTDSYYRHVKKNPNTKFSKLVKEEVKRGITIPSNISITISDEEATDFRDKQLLGDVDTSVVEITGEETDD